MNLIAALLRVPEVARFQSRQRCPRAQDQAVEFCFIRRRSDRSVQRGYPMSRLAQPDLHRYHFRKLLPCVVNQFATLLSKQLRRSLLHASSHASATLHVSVWENQAYCTFLRHALRTSNLSNRYIAQSDAHSSVCRHFSHLECLLRIRLLHVHAQNTWVVVNICSNPPHFSCRVGPSTLLSFTIQSSLKTPKLSGSRQPRSRHRVAKKMTCT